MKATTYKNQTFSIPIDIVNDLHALVKNREISQFVATAIKKELSAKKTALKRQYMSANKDKGQKEVAKDWESTIIDGNNDW